MCVQFDDKHGLMLMTFPRRATRFHGKTKAKTTSLKHPCSLVDEWVA
jgi:hypothetical protein